MRFLRLVAAAIGPMLCVTTAHAGTIVANNSCLCGYFTPGVQSIGQSLTTPVGGPWNAIAFNFYDTVINSNGGAVALGPALAYGDLYLLSQSYTGLPSGLSSSTPGFIADTSTISSGEWIFGSAVTLQGSTQYYFYTDTTSTARVADSTPYPDGTAQRTFGTLTYHAESASDAAFLLQGTPTATPEPESLVLVSMGLFAAAVSRWRKCI